MNNDNEIKFKLLVLDDFSSETLNERLKLDLNHIDKRLENLKVGDIVLISSIERNKNKEKHLNETKFYFVQAKDDSNLKYLCETNKTPNQMPCVPLKISKHLQNNKSGDLFIKKYENLFQIFKDYSNCFKAIELEFNSHSSLLPRSFLSKSINDENYKLYYFFQDPQKQTIDDNNNDFKGDFYVLTNDCQNSTESVLSKLSSLSSELEDLSINDQSISESDCVNESFDINRETDDSCYENIKERDPEMEEYNKKFRKIYETQFIDFLKSLKQGQALSVTSLPTKSYCKETYEEDSMNSITLVFYFNSLELDDIGNINAVVADSFDRSQKFYFHPFLCEDYGPYFRATLYTCLYNVGRKNSQEQLFFLDLPIDLYNLLDSD